MLPAEIDLPGERGATIAAHARHAWRSMPPLVRAFVLLDVLVLGLYVLSRFGSRLQLLNVPVIHFFDLDREGNLPTWYAAAKLFLIGLALCGFAVAQLNHGRRAGFSLLLGGAAFVFLSLNEATSLHERFGAWLDSRQGGGASLVGSKGVTLLICAPLFLAGIAALAVASRYYLRGRPAIAWRFAVGAAVFVIAAAGVDTLTAFLTATPTMTRLIVLFEEGGEKIGATIILWATCDLLRSHGLRISLRTPGVRPRPPRAPARSGAATAA